MVEPLQTIEINLHKMTQITVDQLKHEINSILKVSVDDIAVDSHFVADLGADSLALVELTMAFETAFGIEIPDEVAEHMMTVRDVLDFLKGV